MDDRKSSGIPSVLASACGLAVGAGLGLDGGKAIAATLTSHLPGSLQDHAGLIEQVAGGCVALGGAAVGNMLAIEKPAEAIVLALAAAPTMMNRKHAENSHVSMSSEEPTPFQTDPCDSLDGAAAMDTSVALGIAPDAFGDPNPTLHPYHPHVTDAGGHASAGEVVETGLHLL
jgi:hypothetical protein